MRRAVHGTYRCRDQRDSHARRSVSADSAKVRLVSGLHPLAPTWLWELVASTASLVNMPLGLEARGCLPARESVAHALAGFLSDRGLRTLLRRGSAPRTIFWLGLGVEELDRSLGLGDLVLEHPRLMISSSIFILTGLAAQSGSARSVRDLSRGATGHFPTEAFLSGESVVCVLRDLALLNRVRVTTRPGQGRGRRLVTRGGPPYPFKGCSNWLPIGLLPASGHAHVAGLYLETLFSFSLCLVSGCAVPARSYPTGNVRPHIRARSQPRIRGRPTTYLLVSSSVVTP